MRIRERRPAPHPHPDRFLFEASTGCAEMRAAKRPQNSTRGTALADCRSPRRPGRSDLESVDPRPSQVDPLRSVFGAALRIVVRMCGSASECVEMCGSASECVRMLRQDAGGGHPDDTSDDALSRPTSLLALPVCRLMHRLSRHPALTDVMISTVLRRSLHVRNATMNTWGAVSLRRRLPYRIADGLPARRLVLVRHSRTSAR